MTNNILLFIIALCIIGIVMSCLATVPSFGATANIEIPTNEIEIIFVSDK